jgi:hypothetical protein
MECWLQREVARNVDTDELEDLSLSAGREGVLAACMNTPTDGDLDWGGNPNVRPGARSLFADVALPPAP